MDRGWWWKFGLIVAVTLGCIWFLIPTYYSLVVLDREQRNNLAVLEERMPAWAPPAKYRLNLGLDLQGGIHMVMRVDTKTALQKRTERRAQQIVNYVNDKKLGEVSADTDPEKLEVTLTAKDPGTMDAIQKEVLATFTDFKEVSRSGASLTLVQDESQANVFRTEAVDQAMLVIRRRIDKWGVAEVDAETRNRG